MSSSTRWYIGAGVLLLMALIFKMGLLAYAMYVLLGLLIGRWWSLLVTVVYAVIHAIPVYLGLLPGYLSTWGEALWWAFALTILLALTGLGVLSRMAIRWLRRRYT